MSAGVAILHPAPAFRDGLAAALSRRGHAILDEPGEVAVLLADGAGCAAVDHLAAAGVAVIALVAEATASAVAHMLRHGAVAVLAWSADADTIADAVDSALSGISALPADAARALADEWPDAHRSRPDIAEEEMQWITALSRGTTVARLADDFGYSERAMFRRLHDLYSRLGASNRSEAIAAAVGLGLIDKPA